jgi:hypothetical protein
MIDAIASIPTSCTAGAPSPSDPASAQAAGCPGLQPSTDVLDTAAVSLQDRRPVLQGGVELTGLLIAVGVGGTLTQVLAQVGNGEVDLPAPGGANELRRDEALPVLVGVVRAHSESCGDNGDA